MQQQSEDFLKIRQKSQSRYCGMSRLRILIGVIDCTLPKVATILKVSLSSLVSLTKKIRIDYNDNCQIKNELFNFTLHFFLLNLEGFCGFNFFKIGAEAVDMPYHLLYDIHKPCSVMVTVAYNASKHKKVIIQEGQKEEKSEKLSFSGRGRAA